MNNKYFFGLIFFLFIAVALLLKEDSVKEATITHKISAEHIKAIEDKGISEVIEETSDSAQTTDLPVKDEPWEENVKVQLKRQAMDDNVEVNIIKESALFWEEMGTSIEANTIKVQLRTPAGETTSFRALIDSNTGKVLRTWDRPVLDPINPRERSGIRINSRYHTR